jgi:receptor protein-tyrosine kinase
MLPSSSTNGAPRGGSRPDGPTHPGDQGSDNDLAARIRALAQHWRLILLCALLAGGAAYAYAESRPAKYEATARLLIQGNDLGETVVGLQQSQQVDPEREAATALALAQQPSVAAKTIERLDLSVSTAELQRRITASADGNSRLIAIAAVDSNARFATRLANEYARQYIAFRRTTARAEVNEALSSVEREIQTVGALEQTERMEELRNRRAQLETLSGLTSGGAQLIQPATGKGTSVSANALRTGIVGLVLGSLLGLGLAFLRNRLDPRIKREEEISQILPGVPVIAAIPSWLRDTDKTPLSEGFRAMRTTLSFLDPEHTISSIVVTSATVGEGKTTTSLNLALAIAEREESVLVLEGDLRRRGLSERLGLLDEPGVSDVLSGDLSVEECVVPTSLLARPKSKPRAKDGPNGVATSSLEGTLNVVPSGRVTDNPQRLLTSDRVRRLLGEATQYADKVIVDGTPLGLLNDMLPVAAQADALVIVVHLHYTRRAEFKRLAAHLAQSRIQPFGLVVFGVDSDRGYDAYVDR